MSSRFFKFTSIVLVACFLAGYGEVINIMRYYSCYQEFVMCGSGGPSKRCCCGKIKSQCEMCSMKISPRVRSNPVEKGVPALIRCGCNANSPIAQTAIEKELGFPDTCLNLAIISSKQSFGVFYEELSLESFHSSVFHPPCC